MLTGSTSYSEKEENNLASTMTITYEYFRIYLVLADMKNIRVHMINLVHVFDCRKEYV